MFVTADCVKIYRRKVYLLNLYLATPKTPEYPLSSESSNFLHFGLLYWISKFRVKIRNQRPQKSPSTKIIIREK